MKVYLGPYKTWVGPFQIAEYLLFWRNKYDDDSVFDFGLWLSQKKDGSDSWLTKACNWIDSKRKRKIKVQIDNYDVWNLDGTLALIILPALKKLKEQKHGSGFVDLEDLPKHLQFTETEDYDLQQTFDFYCEAKDKASIDVHTKYEWLLDEMIWTFEQLQPDWDWQEQYKYDWKAMGQHQERIDNGLRLFGKYFQTLWD